MKTLGKIIDPPNKNRVPAHCAGTLAYIDQIEKVAQWFVNNGWNVIFKKDVDSELVPATNSVVLQKNIAKHTLLFMMLHEAGHLKLLSRPDYYDLYTEGYRRDDLNLNKKCFKHRVEVLQEEFDAWREGEILAKELNISLDTKLFRNERNRSIKTYVEWSLHPEKYVG